MPKLPHRQALLEAHVRFELERWSGDRFPESVSDEVHAAFAWLGTTTLNDVTTSAEVGDWIARNSKHEITDDLVESVAAAIGSARGAARTDDRTLSELVPREVYDEYADLVIGMKDARRALIEQITTSEVYSRLIAHVMYHGIKNYLLTESVIARRVPGASSLMRLGQSALNSAAPNLEKGIDRQLTAFVNANIADSIRESKDYLDTVVDDEVLAQVAAELWASNADAAIADAVALIPDETVDGFVAAGRELIDHLRTTDSFESMTARAVDDFFADHGSRPIADLLADAGVTAEFVTAAVADFAGPFVSRAVEDGYLEGRLLARLGAFYAAYDD